MRGFLELVAMLPCCWFVSFVAVVDVIVELLLLVLLLALFTC
jgi:hypothetical protein